MIHSLSSEIFENRIRAGGPVADLEIFRGGFSFTKTPAKLKVKTKKKKKKTKVFTSFLDYLFLAAVSLPSSTAPKLTQ